jgi:diguanylate cyclase (GGDEF)-like protein
MIFDIDRFQAINDLGGHARGDLVLQQVADIFRDILRLNDTISRIGSDEFSIIIEDFDEINSLSSIVGKIYSAFKQPIIIGTQEIFITLSGGSVIYPSDALESEDLMSKAYIALAQAKADGRNIFRYHSEAMAKSAQRRQTIETMLRSTIAHGELSLNYQMRVSAKTNELTGMEALARWESGKLGGIRPDEFIPIAEDSGQILQLGDFVFRLACRQYSAWRAEGLDPGVMAVNFSAPQFHQPGFIQWMHQVTTEAGVAAENIELELTESMLIEDCERAALVMRQLRDLGFGIAIDDFGTGFSSLSHLKKFPFTKIKIDREFIKNIENGREDVAIASAIVTLANSLSMSVTAEGVETAGQLECLEKLNCDEYQGYYFYKPVSAQEAGLILRQRQRVMEKMAI